MKNLKGLKYEGDETKHDKKVEGSKLDPQHLLRTHDCRKKYRGPGIIMTNQEAAV